MKVISMFFCLFFVFGTKVFATETANEETIQKLKVFSRVLNYLEQNYIDPVQSKDLIEEALKGITTQLDPHTGYVTKDEYAQMKIETSGKFGGIGVEMGMNENKELIVIKPMDTGPAIQKGIKAGDRILEVDGVSTQGWSIADAIQNMRGPRGSIIRLKLIHEDSDIPYEVEIRRTIIHMQSVASRIVLQEYGYVQIRSFQESTDQDVIKAIKKMKKDMEKKSREMKGLVLDLRNNPGGLLDQAVKITDLFIDDGIIVSTKGRHSDQVDISYATKETTLPYIPMVTLINEGTASASEIVAGALQDHARSVLIGTPTFGKGSVQSIVDLEDGSGLKMTVARYYTPKDRPIQNLGNQPDLYVSFFNYRPEDDFFRTEKDLEGRLETLEISGKKQKKASQAAEILDPQLKAAIEFLKTTEKTHLSQKKKKKNI